MIVERIMELWRHPRDCRASRGHPSSYNRHETHTSIGVQHVRTVEGFSLSVFNNSINCGAVSNAPDQPRIGGAGVEIKRSAANIPMTKGCSRLQRGRHETRLGPESPPAEILELSHSSLVPKSYLNAYLHSCMVSP